MLTIEWVNTMQAKVQPGLEVLWFYSRDLPVPSFPHQSYKESFQGDDPFTMRLFVSRTHFMVSTDSIKMPSRLKIRVLDHLVPTLIESSEITTNTARLVALMAYFIATVQTYHILYIQQGKLSNTHLSICVIQSSFRQSLTGFPQLLYLLLHFYR